MAAPAYDVLVLGAGFTGTALTVQLARRLPAPSRILLIGSPGAIGRGLAYGTDNPLHLLNVRAERMSLFPDDPGHFVRWLERHPPSPGRRRLAGTYAPRRLYGRYLRDTLNEAIASARTRVRVETLEATATEVVRREHGHEVRTASGQHFAGRVAALCLGNGAADFPFDVRPTDAAVRDRLIADPWSDYRMRAIRPEHRVLFVGSGLTMVDQVLALDAAGHGGPLAAISRHGLLPAPHLPVRTEPSSIALPRRGRLTLLALFGLVVDAARDEAAAGRDWRSVIDGLRPRTQELWARLDAADRRRLLRHLAAFWSVHRHRMPPEAAARIAALRDGGRLTVAAGRVLAVGKASRGVLVAFRPRGGETVELWPFDWIVNCSGSAASLPEEAKPVIRQLVASGLGRADALDHGVEVAADGAVIGRSGVPTPGLYALGPLTMARFFEILAVPEIRIQCDAVAGTIAAHLDRDRRMLDFLPRGTGSIGRL
jgi:uncharacterized NAD(P)/FAD-binding protein YdhS